MFSKFAIRLALALLIPACSAQTSTVTGTVADPAGAAISNAEVTIENSAAAFQRTVRTGESASSNSVTCRPVRMSSL
jgi:hypothetical protein